MVGKHNTNYSNTINNAMQETTTKWSVQLMAAPFPNFGSYEWLLGQKSGCEQLPENIIWKWFFHVLSLQHTSCFFQLFLKCSFSQVIFGFGDFFQVGSLKKSEPGWCLSPMWRPSSSSSCRNWDLPNCARCWAKFFDVDFYAEIVLDWI